MSDVGQVANRKQRRGTIGRSSSVREMQTNQEVVRILHDGFKPEVGESEQSAVRRLFVQAGAKDRKRRVEKRKATKQARRNNR